jgi:hypothetical protein
VRALAVVLVDEVVEAGLLLEQVVGGAIRSDVGPKSRKPMSWMGLRNN